MNNRSTHKPGDNIAQESVKIYFVGTAGSGKSTLCGAFGEQLEQMNAKVTRINLDPGADTLPYKADIDIRENINLYDVMKEYGLGPNGAQIACADRIALQAKNVREAMEGVRSDYILIDTPGQIELFAYRNSSKVIMDEFGTSMSQMVFLCDPFLSQMPSGFIAQQLLYIGCQLRFNIPSVTVLSKCDMVEEKIIETMEEWAKDPQTLYSAAMNETISMGGMFHFELLRSIMDMELFTEFFRCSSKTGAGLLNIYNTIQLSFAGGEDIPQ